MQSYKMFRNNNIKNYKIIPFSDEMAKHDKFTKVHQEMNKSVFDSYASLSQMIKSLGTKDWYSHKTSIDNKK